MYLYDSDELHYNEWSDGTGQIWWTRPNNDTYQMRLTKEQITQLRRQMGIVITPELLQETKRMIAQSANLLGDIMSIDKPTNREARMDIIHRVIKRLLIVYAMIKRELGERDDA